MTHTISSRVRARCSGLGLASPRSTAGTGEGCQSGRMGTLGKRVRREPPWVQIPYPPRYCTSRRLCEVFLYSPSRFGGWAKARFGGPSSALPAPWACGSGPWSRARTRCATGRPLGVAAGSTRRSRGVVAAAGAATGKSPRQGRYKPRPRSVPVSHLGPIPVPCSQPGWILVPVRRS